MPQFASRRWEIEKRVPEWYDNKAAAARTGRGGDPCVRAKRGCAPWMDLGSVRWGWEILRAGGVDWADSMRAVPMSCRYMYRLRVTVTYLERDMVMGGKN